MMSTQSPLALQNLLPDIRSIAEQAGQRIMEVYALDDFHVQEKTDHSPLTIADTAAHETIIAGLKQLTPDIAILSEESALIPFSERTKWQRYWLVDPLDGTREFIKRNGEFTVNIALIENHKAILGVIYAPVPEITYFAAQGLNAFKCSKNGTPVPISVRDCPQQGITIAGSRSHACESLQHFIDKLDMDVDVINVGSSLKSCLVAEGKADIYPRFGPTSEWDTAAAQCIVEEAGGCLTDTNFHPLRYNTKESLLNPHFLVFGHDKTKWAEYIPQKF